jgi:hypothetical protein
VETVEALDIALSETIMTGAHGASAGKRTSQLTGRGGVCLVMYHLARLGLDFVETTYNSNNGDLWIRTPSGKVIKAEVKTCSGPSWPLKRKQMGSVDVYFFVQIRDASVWVVSSREMKTILGSAISGGDADIGAVVVKKMPPGSRDAWSVLGEFPNGSPRVFKRPIKPSKPGSERVVRRTLATGEIKEYRYPR